jgi:hypothetical protein
MHNLVQLFVFRRRHYFHALFRGVTGNVSGVGLLRRLPSASLLHRQRASPIISKSSNRE